MALKYYHAEPMANSLKSMIPLKEKGLAYESVYVDLHKFEQHQDWFVAINPEGQVPVLDHDGIIITHTTVINEYLEDAFPDDQPASGPLRPKTPVGAARMRYWNKFVDEQVMNYVWRRHTLNAATRMLLAPSGGEEGPPLVVGFADIVGYTRQSRSLRLPSASPTTQPCARASSTA